MVASKFRCPMCGRPLHRVRGLEHARPHSRGWDCPHGHATSTAAPVWEAARLAQYREEIENFLHPSDTIDCPGHEWSIVELDKAMAVLECAKCGSMSPLPMPGLV
jgi:predicted RNA-binding Zn-ribbon protein involved in translation (DUF1610 family)